MTPPSALPTTPAHPWRGTLLVLLSAACFGTTLIFVQRALNGGVQLPTLLAYRYVIGSALLLLLAGGLAPVKAVGARGLPLLLLGGSAQAVIAALSAYAVTLISPASVAFLFYTYPTWVAVLAILRRTERVDLYKVLALALSLGGIVTIVGNPFATQLDPLGVLLSVLCALVYALLIPWLGTMQDGLKPASAMTCIASGAALWFVLGAIVLQAPLANPSSVLLVNAGALALIPTAIAFVAFVRGLSELGPVRTSIVSTVEPFWTALLAGVVLGQPVGPRTWIGGALIATAMVVLQRRPAANG